MNEFYIIRHAHALNRSKWDKDDLKRPLTEEGKKRARRAFKIFFQNLNPPKFIYTSAAKRSIDTAKILSKITNAEIIIDETLNPGADNLSYLTIVKSYQHKEPFAIVGHEPEISNFISFYVSEHVINIKVRKGSICHIKNKCIENFINQNVLL
ncbi:MAG: hypothetical protein JG762_969 [Deferribacteraceae bacterium]|jgi:phosphohistidine phosphatase|nr:hypothetical protein [Deferribacteraceae bacterium]